MKVNTYLIVTRYLSSRTSNRRPCVTLGCKRGGANKPRTKPKVDDEEEEVLKKRRGPYGLKSVKIYNVVAKIKKNMMQGQNMVEKVLCLCAQQGYTVFYRNCNDNNVLSDIVVAHPTSIQMMRTWSYVLIMDTTYKTNKWVIQQIKHLYFSNAMSTDNQQDVNAHGPELIKDEEVASWFINGSWHRLLNEIDEQEYLRKLDVLKAKWQRSIDSPIESQITDIKSSLEYSRVKEKFNAKSNPILMNISSKISHLALKKIWVEIKRAPEIIDYPKNKCGHYMRTSHGLPCSCKLITRFKHMLPIQLVDIKAFWKTLEIGGYHPSSQKKDMDMDFEMRSLTDLLHQISIGPISKVREMHRLVKGVLSPVFSKDPYPSLCSTFPYTNAFPTFVYLFIENWKNMIGDGNCDYRVVTNFVFGDEHQWPKIHRRMIFELEHTTNMYLSLFGSAKRVYELICTLVIGLLTDQQHFIQMLNTPFRRAMGSSP
ncbi:hypothetical protein M9H77_12368 [Catharanthus roseus]|uniref:Uncharacterized protein n=1 Tax=Catharanthus roseus TaxID=4058 RepID=A0ACC0BH53_CATRO|nr:hypothetical protein M9H77_12368 [Catharanthus roseus]